MPIDRSCRQCGARFRATTIRRLFCSDTCKTRHNRETRLLCFYCGELANSIDHITPHSTLYSSDQARKYKNWDTVNCCIQCNTLIGDAYPYDFIARIKYLMGRIKEKHQLDKIVPEWADEELAELGYSLKQAIVGKMRRRQVGIQQVLHAQARAWEIMQAWEEDDTPVHQEESELLHDESEVDWKKALDEL